MEPEQIEGKQIEVKIFKEGDLYTDSRGLKVREMLGVVPGIPSGKNEIVAVETGDRKFIGMAVGIAEVRNEQGQLMGRGPKPFKFPINASSVFEAFDKFEQEAERFAEEQNAEEQTKIFRPPAGFMNFMDQIAKQGR